MNLWQSIVYSIVSGIYSTVGWVYDIMLNLLYAGSRFSYDFGESVITTLYVLAGVFMLFRVVISMVQMLINPDQVTDKKLGAGKLLTRVVIVIVLLLFFLPNGYLLSPGDEDGNGAGLLIRLENAIVGTETNTETGESNGLIGKLFQTGNSKAIYDEKASSILFEEVDADSKWTKTCYYYKGVDFSQSVKGEEKSGKYTNTYYKVQFSNISSSGAMLVQGRNEDAPIYMKFITGEDSNIVEGKVVKFKSPGISSITQEPLDKMFNLGYRKTLQYTKVSDCNNWTLKKIDGKLSLVYNKSAKPGGGHWYGANNSTEFVNAIKDNLKNLNTVEGMDDIGSSLKTNTTFKFEHTDSEKFAISTISSFQTCTSDEGTEAKDNCEKAKQEQFSDEDAPNEIVDMMGNGEMKLDFITAIIAGIGLIIFIVVLCVDVVVRQLKLALLGAMAPIPIVSYADPNDKVFMNWLKMYVNVYVSLFIKLIAIKFAVVLLAELSSSGISKNVSGLENFFYIIGILIFAKSVPTILSKIFNLEFGSSFKDIAGMVKKGAGLASGAAIGGAVGGVTGGLTGMLRGAARGAGAGVKGDFTGGAAKTAAYNRNLAIAKESGSTVGGRMMAALGLNDYESQKRAIDVRKSEMAEAKANEMNQIQNRKNENANTLSNIKGYEDRVESNLFDKTVYDNFEIKGNWSQEQKDAAKKTQSKVYEYRKAIADLSSAEASGDSQAIYEAGIKLSNAKKAASDQTKEWEAAYGTDQKAQAYLQNLDPNIVNKGFEKGIDAAKKSIDAENIALNSKISDLDIKYTAIQQEIERDERELENSETKANYDANKSLRG